jgi:hypothetical protein
VDIAARADPAAPLHPRRSPVGGKHKKISGLDFRVADVSDYRFYTLTKDGHIAGPPGNYWLPDDAAAVKRAKLIINGSTIEIWQGTRVVARLVPEPE